MATRVQTLDTAASGSREYRMEAHQAAEALVASMKLNGIDRLWFVSGTELAFFQESAVKHRVLGRPVFAGGRRAVAEPSRGLAQVDRCRRQRHGTGAGRGSPGYSLHRLLNETVGELRTGS